MLSKIFVDDIIFGGQDVLCKAFANEMKQEFEMSIFGEIKFFVGLQIYQMKYGIYMTQSKYSKNQYRSIYSLKQAPRAWYDILHKYLVKIGFERTDDNNNLYIKLEKGKGIFYLIFLLMISYLEVKMLYVTLLQMK